MTSLPKIILCPCGQFFKRFAKRGQGAKADAPRKYLVKCSRCETEYFIWDEKLRFFSLHGFYKKTETTKSARVRLDSLKEYFESRVRPRLQRPLCTYGE